MVAGTQGIVSVIPKMKIYPGSTGLIVRELAIGSVWLQYPREKKKRITQWKTNITIEGSLTRLNESIERITC